MTVYSHVVIDVDAGIKADVSKLALGISDIIIIPVNHNMAVLEASKRFRDEIVQSFSRSRRRKELKIFYLLNQYNPSICSYKRVASVLEVRPSKLLTLHHNFELIKAGNSGKISDALADALRGKETTLNLRSDMKAICKALLGKEFLWDIKREVK